MTGATSLLTAMADELFSRTCTREVIDQSAQGGWPEELWRALEDNGLPTSLAPQELGGAGLTIADAMAVLRIAGQYSVPGPLSESLIAGALLAEAGLPLAKGACTLSCTGPWDSLILSCRDSDWLLSGTVSAVSWARSGPDDRSIRCRPRRRSRRYGSPIADLNNEGDIRRPPVDGDRAESRG